MRRHNLLAAVLSVALIVGGVTGCSGAKDESPLDKDNPTTVTVWNYYNGDQLNAFTNLVDEFNDTVGEKEGIVVKSVSQGSIDNLATALIESVEGKVGADDVPSLAAVYSETAFILNNKEALIPLDSYFSKDELSEYIPGFIDEGRLGSEDKLYLFPVSKSTEAFVVNETDWSEFAKATGIESSGIKTYEDLTAAGKAYYEWTDSLYTGC